MEKYGKAFSEMDLKEKAAHLWEYYRKPALFCIIAGILVIQLITAILSPREVNTVDITLAGKIYTEDQATLDEVTKQFKENFDAGLMVSMVDWTKSTEMELATEQRIALQITTKELDILGIPPEKFDIYLRQTGQDMLRPLDEIPECKALLEEYKDQLVIAGYNKDENFNITKGDQHVFGIKVSKIDNIQSSTLNEDLVLGITTTVKDIDKTVEMMRYLLESK
ncbi:hypothetical protein [Cellulosilyticum ruminicola]|uniref:hypothetical protein n=1 Tax=Cellulosilyticum ruminicola TaxID=425254 RepID=UPI0006D216A9|nr:hypothetical protein [Cellulosilyticum ruminicola]